MGGKKDEMVVDGNSEERRERRKKVWVGYGKIRINEQWWKWDEEKRLLRDGNGNVKKLMIGEGHKRREEGGNRRGQIGRGEGWGRRNEGERIENNLLERGRIRE